MAKLITVAYVTNAAKRKTKLSQNKQVGKKQDIKRNNSAIYAGSIAYIIHR